MMMAKAVLTSMFAHEIVGKFVISMYHYMTIRLPAAGENFYGHFRTT